MHSDGHQLSHPKYRPDIDGLRAIAILSVVAFHAFPDTLPAGFVGVDIFFVISGYLISTIIFVNLNKASFSFAEFYARRIKRIFPALIVVLTTGLILGWYVLFVEEYKQLGKHIAGGATFLSNFILVYEAGYFDTSADTKPFLHLWSLSVEEQYYLIYPFLIWFSFKRKYKLLLVIGAIALVSFLIDLALVNVDRAEAFYLPQSRFWELMAGGSLAWISVNTLNGTKGSLLDMFLLPVTTIGNDTRKIVIPQVANLYALLGLSLLMFGFYSINKNAGFPGYLALIPVAGAMFIITAGPHAWANRRILASKWMVGLGLISYPLYLWHWMFLSFARIMEGEVPSKGIRAAAILLSIILAWLTYRFIEIPIRNKSNSKNKVLYLVIVMAVIGATGYLISTPVEDLLAHFTINPHQVRLRDKKEGVKDSISNCEEHFPNWTKNNDNPCRMQLNKGNTIAIIGDSHAGHLYIGLSELLGPNEGVAVFPVSCAAPFINIQSGTINPALKKIRKDAYTLINKAYKYVLADPNINTVVLAHNPICSYNDAIDILNRENKDFNKVLKEGMRRTFDLLAKYHKKVLIIYDNPYLPFRPTLCGWRPVRITDKKQMCFFPQNEFYSLAPWINYKSIVESVLTDYPEIGTYDLSKIFCKHGYCYIGEKGIVYYSDKHHLSPAGSRYAAPYILNAIKSLK